MMNHKEAYEERCDISQKSVHMFMLIYMALCRLTASCLLSETPVRNKVHTQLQTWLLSGGTVKKISFLLWHSALVTHCLLLKGRVEIFQWKICQIVVDVVQLLCQGIPHSQLRQQNSKFTYNSHGPKLDNMMSPIAVTV